MAAAITEAAERVLTGWEDDRLLGQPRARTIVQVTRAVRVLVGRDALDLVARVTSWRLARLLEEYISRAVSQAQGRALRRRMETEGEPPLEYELITNDSNERALAEITVSESRPFGQRESWSADE